MRSKHPAEPLNSQAENSHDQEEPSKTAFQLSLELYKIQEREVSWTSVFETSNLIVARMLFQAGHSVHSVTEDGRTAMHIVAFTGSTKMASLLLELGANASAADSLGNSPLHIASQSNQVEMIKLLISQGAEINSVNDSGLSALSMCAESGHDEAMRFLLSCPRLKPGIYDNRGYLPIH
jgi:ankyrin repeat protein